MTLGSLFWRLEDLLLHVLLSPIHALLLLARMRFLRLLDDHVGHLAADPDTLLKEMRLGLKPRWRVILIVDGPRCANRALVEYWREHFAIWTHPRVCHLLTHLLRHFPSLDLNIWNYHDGGGRGYYIQEVWGHYLRAGGRAPLELKAEHRQRGEAVLRRWGLPAGGWFVCCHARSGRYRPNEEHQDYRNVSPERFAAAMAVVVQHGGWCVIMGDPTMPPGPTAPRVIDYAHSADRADWLDVFLCAAGRFFLGCDSDLLWLPRAFGRPTAITNCTPLSSLPGMGDLVRPKIYREIDSGRRWTLDQALASPAAHSLSSDAFAARGLALDENDAEDIADLASEMLDRLEGRAEYTSEDERLQARYWAWTQGLPHGRHAEGRLGRDFLRRHASELFDAPEAQA